MNHPRVLTPNEASFVLPSESVSEPASDLVSVSEAPAERSLIWKRACERSLISKRGASRAICRLVSAVATLPGGCEWEWVKTDPPGEPQLVPL